MLVRLLIILLIIFPILANSQTCIIAFQTKQEVFVAADTKELGLINEGNKIDTFVRNVCKISVLDKNVIFASAGIQLDALDKLALKCYKRLHKISAAKEDFFIKCQKLLSDFVEEGRKKGQYAYESRFDKVHEGIEFMFCGFEDNIPKVYGISLRSKSKINEPLIFYKSQHREYEQIPNADVQYLIVGERRAIVPIPQYIFDRADGIPSKLNTLIKMQHNLTPYDVGDTCDLIKINKDGIKWIQDFSHKANKSHR